VHSDFLKQNSKTKQKDSGYETVLIEEPRKSCQEDDTGPARKLPVRI